MFDQHRLSRQHRKLKEATTDHQRAIAMVKLADLWASTRKAEDHYAISVLMRAIAHLYDPCVPGGARMSDLAVSPYVPKVSTDLHAAFSGVRKALTSGKRDDAVQALEALYDRISADIGINPAEGSVGTVLIQVYNSKRSPWTVS